MKNVGSETLIDRPTLISMRKNLEQISHSKIFHRTLKGYEVFNDIEQNTLKDINDFGNAMHICA